MVITYFPGNEFWLVYTSISLAIRAAEQVAERNKKKPVVYFWERLFSMKEERCEWWMFFFASSFLLWIFLCENLMLGPVAAILKPWGHIHEGETNSPTIQEKEEKKPDHQWHHLPVKQAWDHIPSGFY